MLLSLFVPLSGSPDPDPDPDPPGTGTIDTRDKRASALSLMPWQLFAPRPTGTSMSTAAGRRHVLHFYRGRTVFVLATSPTRLLAAPSRTWLSSRT